ncbi:hypothetical protein ACFPIJ_16670 [Dactylosporangium cerinum]|uniref:Cas12f1-like TNB domain-containing protein n=1 Tax=Dactylosporangium cerinum TaxID=1434730 RepID=A0ABV9VW76_9ACTN
MLRLPVDVHDPRVRRHLERVFAAAFSVRRAVQRDTRARVDAFWAAHRERATVGPAAVRDRLGLTLSGLEHAAYRHLDAAPHLRRYLTKALAMHLAGGVWQAVDRHLFPDVSGRRHGPPRPGGWWEFNTIPGRARSHTRARKWETWRLVGSLAGHRAVFERPSAEGGRLWQPRRMPVVTPTASSAVSSTVGAAAGARARSWWDHDGALAVVLTGTGDRDLVLPVRLPQGPARRPVLEHYLADPDRWHKVDLVRHRDPAASGGWRYEAHLMILADGHTSPAVAARREAAAGLHRRGGVDVNVSNLAVVSIPTSPTSPTRLAGPGRPTGDAGLRATRIAKTGDDVERLAVEGVRQRRRNRALQRSRRCSNPTQYQLSTRQQQRADRRRAAGLPAVQVATPAGPRIANAAGVPVRAYRHDQLSTSYRRLRAAAAAAGEARTQAGRTRARTVAADLVAIHGPDLIVETGDLRVWARRWGRSMHAFTPGMLLTALDHETAKVTAVTASNGATGGGLVRAGTRHTAWTQHCLCGTRAPKSLAHRRHTCPNCGITGDRDLVAARRRPHHPHRTQHTRIGTYRLDQRPHHPRHPRRGHDQPRAARSPDRVNRTPPPPPTPPRCQWTATAAQHPPPDTGQWMPACSANYRKGAPDNPGRDPHRTTTRTRDRTGTTRRTPRTVSYPDTDRIMKQVLDGVDHTIDLNAANAAELRDTLGPFLRGATCVRRRSPYPTSRNDRRPGRDGTAIRACPLRRLRAQRPGTASRTRRRCVQSCHGW